jgi:hypothetical protein
VLSTVDSLDTVSGSSKPHARKPYVEVKLYHSHQRFKSRSKTVPVPASADGAVFDEHFGPWDVEDDELVFVRCVWRVVSCRSRRRICLPDPFHRAHTDPCSV